MKIGITGHQHLDDDSEWERVRSELRRQLANESPPLIGLTSLAIGADQLFAELILDFNGSIEVVIPFAGYERTFKTESTLENYRKLIAKAAKTTVLPPKQDEEESYFAAGKLVAKSADKLVAVWDGEAAEGLGGTGDVVAYAKQIGKPVILIKVKG